MGAGPTLVVALALGNVLMLPGTFMMLASGYVFGKAFSNLFVALGVGSVATFAGMECGSTSAMIIGRYIFRECVSDL